MHTNYRILVCYSDLCCGGESEFAKRINGDYWEADQRLACMNRGLEILDEGKAIYIEIVEVNDGEIGKAWRVKRSN